jgi:hypothetical protein
MNKALSSSQLLGGVFCSVTGFGRIPCYKPEVGIEGLAVAGALVLACLARSGSGRRHTCAKDWQGE